MGQWSRSLRGRSFLVSADINWPSTECNGYRRRNSLEKGQSHEVPKSRATSSKWHSTPLELAEYSYYFKLSLVWNWLQYAGNRMRQKNTSAVEKRSLLSLNTAIRLFNIEFALISFYGIRQIRENLSTVQLCRLKPSFLREDSVHMHFVISVTCICSQIGHFLRICSA